ncbi:MAG: hypothetical protein AAF215_07070 [Cyanobacteria bacterium P01_A01_bin.123]
MADPSGHLNSIARYVEVQTSIKRCIIDLVQSTIIALETSDEFSQRQQRLNWNKQQPITALDIHRVDDSFPICYRAAIAHQLQSRWQRPLQDIVALLRQHLANDSEGSQCSITPTSTLNLCIEVSILESGWMHCAVTPQSLGIWLSFLNDDQQWASAVPKSDMHLALTDRVRDNRAIAPTTIQPGSTPTDATSFPWQHLHARCCSRLAIAQQLGLITLNKQSARGFQTELGGPSYLQILSPDPVPWLIESEVRHLYLRNYCTLIHAVIALWDASVASHSNQQGKALIRCLEMLYQRFETIDQRQAPYGLYPMIVGNPKRNTTRTLPHSQVSCGVVRAVQVSLQHILTTAIGKAAPIQL